MAGNSEYGAYPDNYSLDAKTPKKDYLKEFRVKREQRELEASMKRSDGSGGVSGIRHNDKLLQKLANDIEMTETERTDALLRHA